MRKRYLLLFSIILLSFSFFSCPNNLLNVTFISYDKGTKAYTTREDRKVKSGDVFGNINTPTPISFHKEGWTYSFKHWTDAVPTDDTIIQENSDAFDDNTEIKENKTVYAVYSKVEKKYTVIFKIFDTSEKIYKEIKTTDKITYLTKFSDISQPQPIEIPNINNYLGMNYTFDYWTTDVPSKSEVKTSGIYIGDETPITDDITLYAVYKGESLKFTVIFKIYSTSIKGYALKEQIENVNYNRKFGDIKPTIIPTIDNHLGRKYTFSHWTTKTPIESYVITNADDVGDETPIICDSTFYAVYIDEPVKYTITFKSIKPSDSGYTEVVRVGDILYKTKYKNVEGIPEVAPIDEYEGHSYSFKYWTEEEPEGRKAKTTGEEFDKETEIKSNITLYAVYEVTGDIFYTVNLKIIPPGNFGYTKTETISDIAYGTKLSVVTSELRFTPFFYRWNSIWSFWMD